MTARKSWGVKIGLGLGLAGWALAMGIGTFFPSSAPESDFFGVTTDPVAVEAKYGSSPKGVTLEGEAQGFPAVARVTYDAARNRFILNDGQQVYDAPIARADMKDVLSALASDPGGRLGVSLLRNKNFIVYGTMNRNTQIAKDLVTADRILGGVVHATPDYLRGVRLPKDYQPVPVRRKRAIWSAARFNYTGYTFAAQPNTNLYRCSNFQLDIRLTPVIPGAAKDGGHALDRTNLQRGILGEPEDIQNVNFLKANLPEFLQMSELARAGKIGEAAAFGRMLKRNNVDLNQLARSM